MTHCMTYDPKKRPFFRAIVRDIDMLEEKSTYEVIVLQCWEFSNKGGGGWEYYVFILFTCLLAKSRYRFKKMKSCYLQLEHDVFLNVLHVLYSSNSVERERERELFTPLRCSWGSSLGALSLNCPSAGPHGNIIDCSSPYWTEMDTAVSLTKT